MFNARTDLAIEAREMYFETGKIDTEIKGVKVEEKKYDKDILVTRVEILDRSGEEALGKGKGHYITIELPKNESREQETYEEACQVCATELDTLLKDNLSGSVLIVGLGNWNITADAVGPKALKSVLVTRHLLEYMPEEIDSRLKSVCAVSPGVLGLTGVETGEIVKGLVQKVQPSLVIAIDALCARCIDRVNNTIQLTDTGIVPGAGVGNRRKALTKETLGVPVIAIGVPTVIDAATIAGDTMDMLIESLKQTAGENNSLLKILSLAEQEDKYVLIKEVLGERHSDFVVTPKEIDTLVDDVAAIIANGINIALHEGITLEDIDRYK